MAVRREEVQVLALPSGTCARSWRGGEPPEASAKQNFLRRQVKLRLAATRPRAVVVSSRCQLWSSRLHGRSWTAGAACKQPYLPQRLWDLARPQAACSWAQQRRLVPAERRISVRDPSAMRSSLRPAARSLRASVSMKPQHHCHDRHRLRWPHRWPHGAARSPAAAQSRSLRRRWHGCWQKWQPWPKQPLTMQKPR